jgi:hypothetical protein
LVWWQSWLHPPAADIHRFKQVFQKFFPVTGKEFFVAQPNLLDALGIGFVLVVVVVMQAFCHRRERSVEPVGFMTWRASRLWRESRCPMVLALLEKPIATPETSVP